MQIIRGIWFRLRALVDREALNREFDDELRDHIARETAANVARGLAPEVAQQHALAAFGGVERFKEDLRDEHRVRWLADLTTDVRHGFRLLRKNKLFSAAVIGTLTLGIGATSTIFTIVNGVLLQTPSYPRPDRVVSISQTSATRGTDDKVVGLFNYVAWRESVRSLSAIALYSSNFTMTLTGSGEPRDLVGAQSTASYFTVLQARAALGRLYTVDDQSGTAPRVVVISHRLWRSMFNSDPTVINRSVTLDETPRTIIGVMPEDFDTPANSALWVPIGLASIEHGPQEYNFDAIGRIRDGMTMDAVQRDLQSLATRVDPTRPPILRGSRIIVMSTHDRRFGSVQKPLTLLLGAVAMLLLIACINVANLTLARSTARRREFAVRLALGASRWRLARQLFVESTILAVFGGAIGTLVPLAAVGAFVRVAPDVVANVQGIHVDGQVLAFTVFITFVAALLFGLTPAITGARSGTSAALASGSIRSGESRTQGVVRSSLVLMEIATALTLLTGAGLLTKSFARALSIDPGFHADNVFGAYVQLPRARYQSGEKRQAFMKSLHGAHEKFRGWKQLRWQTACHSADSKTQSS